MALHNSCYLMQFQLWMQPIACDRMRVQSHPLRMLNCAVRQLDAKFGGRQSSRLDQCVQIGQPSHSHISPACAAAVRVTCLQNPGGSVKDRAAREIVLNAERDGTLVCSEPSSQSASDHTMPYISPCLSFLSHFALPCCISDPRPAGLDYRGHGGQHRHRPDSYGQ